jgi:predicted dithiol-disulfide oxidoreductase (DUF899 family)
MYSFVTLAEKKGNNKMITKKGFTPDDVQECNMCGLICDLVEGVITIQWGMYVEFVCNTCLEEGE